MLYARRNVLSCTYFDEQFITYLPDSVSCCASATCTFIAALLNREFCKVKYAVACVNVSQSTEELKFHSVTKKKNKRGEVKCQKWKNKRRYNASTVEEKQRKLMIKNTGYKQKNGAVSDVNKKFISHLA